MADGTADAADLQADKGLSPSYRKLTDTGEGDTPRDRVRHFWTPHVSRRQPDGSEEPWRTPKCPWLWATFCFDSTGQLDATNLSRKALSSTIRQIERTTSQRTTSRSKHTMAFSSFFSLHLLSPQHHRCCCAPAHPADRAARPPLHLRRKPHVAGATRRAAHTPARCSSPRLTPWPSLLSKHVEVKATDLC